MPTKGNRSYFNVTYVTPSGIKMQGRFVADNASDARGRIARMIPSATNIKATKSGIKKDTTFLLQYKKGHTKAPFFTTISAQSTDEAEKRLKMSHPNAREITISQPTPRPPQRNRKLLGP